MISTDVLDAINKLVVSTALIYMQEPLDPGWAADDSLQNDLDDVLSNHPNLVPHAFAVVDLTPYQPDPVKPGYGPLRPAYAGYSDTQQRKIGSLAKLLALYGAFRLRAQLITLTGANDVADLATAAADFCVDYRRMDAATAIHPLITKMFKPPSAPRDINFTRSSKSRADLNRLYTPGAGPPLDLDFTRLDVREHLRLMAGWSDNSSASSVVAGLGFEFLWALSFRAGLFRWAWEPLTRNDSEPGEPGGLFLGQDFHGNIWHQRPNGVPTVSNQAGSARSVALLLTMLAQDQLVWDYPGNVAMREMLRKSAPNFMSSVPDPTDPQNEKKYLLTEDHSQLSYTEGSPIGYGMARDLPNWHAQQDAWNEDTDLPPVPPTNPDKAIAASKIGLTVGDAVSNGLIVRTQRVKPSLDLVTITAVLVGMDNTTSKWTNLEDFGEQMALKLDKRHGVT